MLEISSRSNEKIKYAVHLGESASFRNERNEFFLEGARLCCDAVLTGISVRVAFFTKTALEKYPDYTERIIEKSTESFIITSDVASKLAQTEGAQGVFCVCKNDLEFTRDLNVNGRYIALENVQDPSNLGAVCRTAEALGLDGIIVSGGCDIFNPKALRAAMGSSLRICVIRTPSLPELLKQAESLGMLTLASTPATDAINVNSVEMTGGIICCVGNEGNGLTTETMNSCAKRITIPMAGRAESLNASAAAAILIWEISHKY